LSTYPDSAPRAPAQIATGVAPPHSLEAEQSVLGGILLSDRAMYGLVIEEGLKSDDFYRDRHRLIYESMLALYRESEPIDVLTVAEHLRSAGLLEDAGGKAAIDELTGGVPGLGGIRRYAQIVREHALMRRLLSTTYEIQASVLNHAAAPRALVEQAERAMLEVAHDDRQKDFRTIDEILNDELKKMEKLSREGTALTGTPSGFRDLDEITGGFQSGNLIVIAARPSMGKSALVTNIAENASIDHGKPVALFSLEMSETELAQRFVASQGRIKGDLLRKGRVADNKWPDILKASAKLASAPLYVDDSSDVGILEIRAKARRLHQQAPLGLIIIDYLQLLRADARIESRVQQVGEMSRGLKILARELDVPVIALSQLSRGVESRTDKRPILSDLRECVTADTLVTLADGRRRPIAELVGTTPDVVAVDDHDRVVRARSDKVWRVGRRPVQELRLASGRRLRATPEHRIRTGAGWQTLSATGPGDRVALARELPEPTASECWPNDRVILLGHLIGDGSYLTHQPLRYTTASEDNSSAVKLAAEREFGATVRRHEGRGNWHQLVVSGNGNRWHPAGVGLWLRDLGVWNQRSAQKRVPDAAFRLPNEQIALLLRHLWATDGTIWSGTRASGGRVVRVAFSTVSEGLSADVAALLLRVGVVARVNTIVQRTGTCLYNVIVSGAADQLVFLERVGGFGPKAGQAAALALMLESIQANTNVDTLPIEAWQQVRESMKQRNVTQRQMTTLRQTSHGGSSHFRFAPSRSQIADYANALGDTELAVIAQTDLFWDRVISIEDAGEEDVYDLTVPGPSCWLADGLVTHNSGQIEQDADLVAFIYREEYYDKETERAGIADIIIAKHRNGAIGDVELTFAKEYPKFLNYTSPERYG
jgi:replicative DNA helicase